MEVFDVAAIARHGKKVLLTLKGFDTINKVTHLVGRELHVRREQLPDLPEGEYYWCDLLGLRVLTDRDEELGILEDIIVTGSNDVYVVTDAGRELLVPAIASVVTAVDLTARRIDVSLPEGLEWQG
jgi:16S rRNA processing protein RimM